MAPVYLSHMPAGTNVKTMLQMAQTFRNGNNFYKYDHGIRGNMQIYGSYRPEEYDLSNVVAPTALIGGDGDGFSDPRDVDLLAKNLPNVLYNYQVELKGFGHLDFILRTDAKSFVYDKVIDTMNKLR